MASGECPQCWEGPGNGAQRNHNDRTTSKDAPPPALKNRPSTDHEFSEPALCLPYYVNGCRATMMRRKHTPTSTLNGQDRSRTSLELSPRRATTGNAVCKLEIETYAGAGDDCGRGFVYLQFCVAK
ncbi:hypothetical protein Bbelb_254310 [Branchiostoma belcheri]|nr:hypothetical protein Bbelb_254310 [Branchiostoma belcheri]